MVNTGYFDIPFASSGTKTTVPDGVQSDGSVSYTQGYGVDYTLDPATNPSALNIEQGKMNQLFFDITSAIQQYQQFGVPPFITTAMNNGSPFSYAQYARVLYSGAVYQSLVNSNTDTPPSVNWKITTGRIQLVTGITLYVSTTGNDSNNGLAIGTPFLTIQKAWNVACSNYDCQGQIITIQIADGTYTQNVNNLLFNGGAFNGAIVINGNSVTPSNVVISVTNANAIDMAFAGLITVQNLKVQTTSSGYGINAGQDVQIVVKNVVFGACVSGCMRSLVGGYINFSTGNTFSGNSIAAFFADKQGYIIFTGQTMTLTGTPAFSVGFCYSNNGYIDAASATFTGSATGPRYYAQLGGIINTNGGSATYLPGNSSGSVINNGLYV